ncbi:MAG: peptide chain release factor N(5)-glutamine methyltransferase [Pseudomonadota bacterium]
MSNSGVPNHLSLPCLRGEAGDKPGEAEIVRGGTQNIGQAIRDAAEGLAPTSPTARLDAELLMAHALGVSRSDMLLRHMRDHVPDTFDTLVARRAAHEPVAYITGETEFYGRRFAVSPDVLIPRSDSETLIEAACDVAPGARTILDLGTGSGCLLLTVMLELGASSGVGTDASAQALVMAQSNAAALGLGTDRVRFAQRDWREAGWAERLNTFDLIICNPPYVEDEAPLDRDVRDFEPASALFSGSEGLDDYRILFPQLRSLMRPQATVILEIGHRQAAAVTELAEKAGFAVSLRHDLANRPRALVLS